VNSFEPTETQRPCEHSTTELPSHPDISPINVHLKPTRLHLSTKVS